MRVGVLVDLFVQLVNQPVKMGNQLFDAFNLRFVNLMQTVFLGSPHLHQPRAWLRHTPYLRAAQTLKLKCRVCAVRTHAVFELNGNLYI